MGPVSARPGPRGVNHTRWGSLRTALFAFFARYASHLRQHGLHHLVVAVGVANAVVLTKPVWVSFEDAASTFAHKATAAVVASRSEVSAVKHVAIVKIDKERFASPSHYAGTSPLDRCQLAKDLAILLGANNGAIRLVAVDLDLSPIERSEFDKVVLSEVYQSRLDNTGRVETMDRAKVARVCQDRLDTQVRNNASRLLLMAPFVGNDKEISNVIEKWFGDMQAAGVRFATVELRATRGLVRNQYREGTSPGEPKLPYFGDAVHQTIKQQPAITSTGENAARETAIPFHALGGYFEKGRDLAVDDACLLPRLKHCDFNVILFGAGYSADDEYETPHGKLHGIDIHAANAACPVATRAQSVQSHFSTHALEILCGALLLAPVMHFFWSKYYRVRSGRRMAKVSWQQRLHSNDQSPQGSRATSRRPINAEFAAVRPHSAFIWLWLLGLLLAGFWLLISCLAPFLSSLCTVVGIPAAFVAGMMVEGAVVQSVQVAAHDMHADHDSNPLALPVAAEGAMPWFTLYRVLFWGVYMAVFVFAVIKLMH